MINSLYGDNIGYSADIIYLNKESIHNSSLRREILISQECDVLLRVDYQGKSFEYLLEFQTRNDRSIGIRLLRYSFELKVQNVKILNNPIVIDLPNPYVIVLEENKNVPDSYELILKVPSGESLKYSSKVLKYWQYDLDALYENNLYLLFPLKVFEVRKKISKAKLISLDNPRHHLLIKDIRDDILKVTRDILEHIDVIYKDKKIDDSEYNEFGVVIANLTVYLCQEIDKLSDVNEEVTEMVKTFYDPKVAERSDQNATLRTKREDILELLGYVGTISEEVKELVEKESNLEILKKWLKLSARARSIDEFLDKVHLN